MVDWFVIFFSYKMEESEKDKPKNDEKAPEQNNQKNKSESVPEDKNLNIYEQYQSSTRLWKKDDAH